MANNLFMFDIAGQDQILLFCFSVLPCHILTVLFLSYSVPQISKKLLFKTMLSSTQHGS